MTNLPKGGAFLLGTTDYNDIFTPEDFNDEHRMVADSMTSFLDENVFAVMDDLEHKKEGLMRELLVKAGEYGFLGMDIPEKYDGTETDEICSTIIAEKVGATGSFAISHGGQTGIGNLPIVYFGNEEQKAKYLPAIVSAEKITAYALTEPGSGSDAMSASTKAVLNAEGTHYILSGGKTFISNAGIADIFIVYAKIDGDKFSAFIVDAHSEGLTTGAEENKMGLKGSSTRSVFFDNVAVPVENLLYEEGKGHVVAFNILNVGRHKVAANGLGAAKYALDLATQYANERKQFKVPISTFGLMKEKLGEMASRIYAAESAIYRTGGLLENSLESFDRTGADGGQLTAKAIEEYAMECSLEKIFASEVEGYAVDEGVQIHGGYGFIAEYPIERLYRDARIRRIFEGTNEINRIIIPTTLLRRAKKESIPLWQSISEIHSKAKTEQPKRESAEDIIQAAKDAFLFTFGHAHEKFGAEFMQQQEILGRIADMAGLTYAMESALLRARKAEAKNSQNVQIKTDMATVFIYSAIEKISLAAQEILLNLGAGDAADGMLDSLKNLLNYSKVDIIATRRKIAETISAAGKYIS